MLRAAPAEQACDGLWWGSPMDYESTTGPCHGRSADEVGGGAAVCGHVACAWWCVRGSPVTHSMHASCVHLRAPAHVGRLGLMCGCVRVHPRVWYATRGRHAGLALCARGGTVRVGACGTGVLQVLGSASRPDARQRRGGGHAATDCRCDTDGRHAAAGAFVGARALVHVHKQNFALRRCLLLLFECSRALA